MSSIRKAARSDPVGAGLVVCGAVLAVLGVLYVAPPPEPELPAWRWPEWGWPTLRREPERITRPIEKPPEAWATAAKLGDVLAVSGHQVAYWGRPDVAYGRAMTAAAVNPVAVVVHYTDNRSIVDLVRYQHNGDAERGGSYGYHVYVDPVGRVLQGAPLSVRTNHIKPKGHSARKAAGAHLDSANTIGVSLVGACRSAPMMPITYACSRETVTAAQLAAASAAVLAIQQRFSIACGEVYGHGDLQHDRQSFEGATVSRHLRALCGTAPSPGADKIEIAAAAPAAAVELERAYAAGLRDMLYIHDERPRVIARRGETRWLPKDPGRPFTGPAFAAEFLAAHPEYAASGGKR